MDASIVSFGANDFVDLNQCIDTKFVLVGDSEDGSCDWNALWLSLCGDDNSGCFMVQG